MIKLLHRQTLAATCVIVLTLASCGKQPSDDCLDLAVYPPSPVTDFGQDAYACVERNAAMYAKGPDSPESLSRAVIAKCKTNIHRHLEREGQAADGSPPYRKTLEEWRQHSLPIIAEARARRCYS